MRWGLLVAELRGEGGLAGLARLCALAEPFTLLVAPTTAIPSGSFPEVGLLGGPCPAEVWARYPAPLLTRGGPPLNPETLRWAVQVGVRADLSLVASVDHRPEGEDARRLKAPYYPDPQRPNQPGAAPLWVIPFTPLGRGQAMAPEAGSAARLKAACPATGPLVVRIRLERLDEGALLRLAGLLPGRRWLRAGDAAQALDRLALPLGWS